MSGSAEGPREPVSSRTPGGLSVTEQMCCLLLELMPEALCHAPFLKDPDRLQSSGTLSPLVAALPGAMAPLGALCL